MKAISTSLAVAGPLCLALFLAACASDQADIVDNPDATAPGSGRDGAPGNGPPPNADSGSAPPQTCSSTCTTDVQCQNWCPELDSGVYCCDLSGLCYPSATSTCPSTAADGGSLPD